MATPKGMRRQPFPVNSTDDIHVFSDDTHIWVQLRRKVPSDKGLDRSSFKAAICITPGTAKKLGLELLELGTVNQEKLNAKNSAASAKTKK